MKKEENFEQRDKLHSFVREHKPKPSFARSASKKRKNVIFDVDRRKLICVGAEFNAKPSSRKRHRIKSADTTNKYYSKTDDDLDYIPSNLESKRRRITPKNKLLSERNLNNFSKELKINEKLDEEKQQALNKAFYWRFQKLSDKGYFRKEMVPHRRKPRPTKMIQSQSANYEQYSDSSDIEISTNNSNTEFEIISSESDENNSETYSNTLESNLIKNNQTIPFESVSALNSNTNLNTGNNTYDSKCVCNSKPCTLKARLLASTTINSNSSNSNSTSNQSSSEANYTIIKPTAPMSTVHSRIVPIKPDNMQRVSTLESDVILCLTNLKNFVNSEAAQLNDTISKIPLRSIVEPVPNINQNERSENTEPQINPPYNINIVDPNARDSLEHSTQNSLFQKYIRNKAELSKNISSFLEQNKKRFRELLQQRNECISELQHAERAKDYFKVEWIKNRLQFINYSIEKIKADCKYDSSEINKFTFEQYLNMLEHCSHRQIPSTSVTETENIQRELSLRHQEQLNFFSNDSLVEGNRVLKYPFGGIITNTNEHSNINQQPPLIPINKNQVVPPDHTTKLMPIPQYLMQNHTVVRSSEKEQTPVIQKCLNNRDKTPFNQQPLINQSNSYQQHPPEPPFPLPPYTHPIINIPANHNPNISRINSVIQVSQNIQQQYTINQKMCGQRRNLNHSTNRIRVQQNQKNIREKQNDVNIYSESTNKQIGRSSIITCAPHKNTHILKKSNSWNNSTSTLGTSQEPIIIIDDVIISSEANKITTDSSTVSQEITSNENVPQPQLNVQENLLRSKPALIPIGVIRKLQNKEMPVLDSTHKQNEPTVIVNANEEIPNKRIKLDNNPPSTSNVVEPENISNITDPEIIIDNDKTNKEINVKTGTTTNQSNENNDNDDAEICDLTDENDQNKEESKGKKYLRLQFNLISNKTISLSYLLKMMNQNLNSNLFSNFILKPKNIEELCNIIRKREIFSKIKENSPYQYPNVLTIMNHFLIYVIVCVQIENKINYKELYLKLIRDNGPIRYDYYHVPDPISLENIDMYLQKAALELHEAIILNSAENNMKNNKCICSKIKKFTSSKPKSQNENDSEEFDNNYFIKAHGETEISIIVLYEPKIKNPTNVSKKFKPKCQDDVSPDNTRTIDKVSEAKQKSSSENVNNVQKTNNSTTFTNLNADIIKNTDIGPLNNQIINYDSNKNMLLNFDISQLAKSFENWEKLLENPDNQRIVSEIFDNYGNQPTHKDGSNDGFDAEIKNATSNKNKHLKNGSKQENSSSPDLDKTFDNIWNDMENSNELITMSEEELENEIVNLLDKDVNVNNEIIRKRRISLSESCLEPSFKNIRIQAEGKLNTEKSLQNQSKVLTNKQNNTFAEKLETIKDKNELNIADNKLPDFAKINKYKVINIDKKNKLIPSIHETITNYWKNADYKNNNRSSNTKTSKRKDEKKENTITSEPLVVSINEKSKNLKAKNKINEEITKHRKENNKNSEKNVETRSFVESSFEMNKKYYNDPKIKINVDKNNDVFQNTPLDLTKPIKKVTKNKEYDIKETNNKESKTENKNNMIIKKSQSNDKNDKKHNCKRSKFEKPFLEKKNSYLDMKRLSNGFLEHTNNRQSKNINATKFCINFNTLVYINEIDYQIVLEILNEVAKPLYTFYKFVNTTRCNNNQPLMNFTAFFFGLKFKKLQKYKKMYEELHQK